MVKDGQGGKPSGKPDTDFTGWSKFTASINRYASHETFSFDTSFEQTVSSVAIRDGLFDCSLYGWVSGGCWRPNATKSLLFAG